MSDDESQDHPVRAENLNTGVVVMESAQDGHLLPHGVVSGVASIALAHFVRLPRFKAQLWRGFPVLCGNGALMRSAYSTHNALFYEGRNERFVAVRLDPLIESICVISRDLFFSGIAGL